MKRNFLFFLFAAFIFSCSDNDFIDNSMNNQATSPESTNEQSVQLSLNQAKSYAHLFYKGLEQSSTPDGKTRAAASAEPSIKNIDFIVEGKDTLLYAINYANNRGYIILAGANNSFPIIAHNDIGNIDFTNIDKESQLAIVINNYKNKVKKELNDTSAVASEYFQEWKDLGKKGYEYEIELNNSEPKPSASTRGRRKYSSGKESIYPYTGKELDHWCQDGGYNYFAENKAAIGCPAIAIGMLMYDTGNRITGRNITPYPHFDYFDHQDILKIDSTSLAKKLRYIADQIPNYSWGKSKGAESGANTDDIVIGLHKLGYTKAQVKTYNFEELYNNMKFVAKDYFGKDRTFNRGILIRGYSPSRGGGHIWFCDGYYEQSYTVKKKFLGIKIKKWTEYDDRLYMNWGWGPKHGNGWYSATDDKAWYSLEGYPEQDFKVAAKMFINLSIYEPTRK